MQPENRISIKRQSKDGFAVIIQRASGRSVVLEAANPPQAVRVARGLAALAMKQDPNTSLILDMSVPDQMSPVR
jgi:hypothetical protein